MSEKSSIVELPSVVKAKVRQERRDRQEAMISELNAENASEDIQSFIRFAATIGLSPEQVRLRLPGALDESADGMSSELRRLHIKRMNRTKSEDRDKI